MTEVTAKKVILKNKDGEYLIPYTENGGDGFSLFDTKLTDRILTGDEALGWALQGSLVTMTYPDAVNRIKEEYAEGTVAYIKQNLPLPEFTSNTTNGITVSDSGGHDDAYSLINGVSTMYTTGPWSSYWFNIDYDEQTYIKTYSLKADNSGEAEYPSAWTLQANNGGDTDWVTLDTQTAQTFTKNQQKTYPVNSETSYRQYRIVFSDGEETSGGNGELSQISFDVDNILFEYKTAVNGHLIADISQKTAIDTLYSETGIADFYILDSTNNQFYLPRNKYFMQLTDSPTLLNNYNEAGLPNITGNTGKFLTSAKGNTGYWDGAFSSSTSSNDHGAHSYSDERYGVDVNFDAGNSNSIYGNSETVQPPSSNKLLYYKVGHTVTNSGSIDVANILSDISSLQEYTGTIDDSIEEAITKTFVPLESIGIAAGTTDLSSYLPADGAIYLVWVEVSTSGKSGTHQTSLSSDVFTVSTSVSMTDADDGRSSNDVSTTCIPVGAERKITKTGDGAAYLKGYCKL